MLNLEVISHGTTNYGLWCYGKLIQNEIVYTGMFTFDKAYEITDKSVYVVKKCDISQSSKSQKLLIKLSL